MNRFLRILVLSNNCFSRSNNNGRTLGSFFIGWPHEKLAQFYIKDDFPDNDLCSNFLCVSDLDALKSIFGKKSTKSLKNTLQGEEIKKQDSKPSRFKKTPFTMLLRHLIWRSSFWMKEDFSNFINAFNPEMLMLQAGDTSFMYDLAVHISNKKNIPLVMYNSEDHVLRKKDYFYESHYSFFWPIFHFVLYNSFIKAFNKSQLIIYSSEKLRNSYERIQPHRSEVLYTSSEIKPNIRSNNNPLIVSYFGNLDFERYISLIELACSFQKADKRIKIDVYGKVFSGKMEEQLMACNAVRVHGFVPYSRIIRVIENSDILVHVESFSKYFNSFNAHYFTTKIADCLASGKCFLAYAPPNIAFMEYLMNNNAAICVTESNELDFTINQLVSNKEYREQKIFNALKLAKKNHNILLNRDRFQKMLCSTIS